MYPSKDVNSGEAVLVLGRGHMGTLCLLPSFAMNLMLTLKVNSEEGTVAQV